MENYEDKNYGDLFNNEELDKKSSYEEKSTSRGQDGLYRVDMDKISPEHKNRGYRSTLRFLMNVTNDPELVKVYAGDKYNDDTEIAVGPSFYKKVSHYINIQAESMKHVNGYYDCPTSTNPYTQKPYTTENYGPFAKTFFTLDKSNNSLSKERAKAIKYNNKYFSYVLVMEDEQQPELVGKIMIFSYGKQIKDIIEAERNGDITGVKCNIFSPDRGKDFILMAKTKTFTNNSGKEVTAPDYTISRFSDNPSPMKVAIKTENGFDFKQVPVDENGRIKSSAYPKVVQFLLSRDVTLENFAAQAWTEEQQEKASEAIDYLTGKTSAAIAATETDADIDDFSFDDASPSSKEPVVKKQEPVTAGTGDSDFDDDFGDFDDDF